MRKWVRENYFLVRKLHSLSGIFPIGIFLMEHLFTNSFATRGPEVYNEQIEWLQSMPYVLFAEVTFIFAPILFHALLGIVFLWAWQDNSLQYKHARNWMYTLQRVSGMVAFIFIGYHVWEFRIQSALTDIPVDFNMVQASLDNSFIFYFYVVGITSVVFHFANGIWNFLVHWGITTAPRAQKISGYVCASLGVLLLYAWLDSLWAFV